ncbi:cytochrome c [Granulicella sp. S190]|uniref:c-type cytochrome n=1 Tax=Granulicella sp. S190 TaxID=1747226 RepID=UPI00352A885A
MNSLGIVLTLIAMACVPAFASSAAEQRGAAIFVDNGCQHCHTIRGQGGTKGPDLSGVGLTLKSSKIRGQILQGGSEMPSFAKILKKSEVDDLVYYLRSCHDKPK